MINALIDRVGVAGVSLLTVALALGCAPPAEPEPEAPPRDLVAEARAGIDAGNERLSAALAAGDAQAAAAAYTADGWLLPPNAEPVKGREAIAEFWGELIASGVGGAKLETIEVQAGDGWAWEVGRVEILGAEGEVLDVGSYAVGWAVEDGVWKLRRDIWNSDRPAAAEPANG